MIPFLKIHEKVSAVTIYVTIAALIQSCFYLSQKVYHIKKVKFQRPRRQAGSFRVCKPASDKRRRTSLGTSQDGVGGNDWPTALVSIPHRNIPENTYDKIASPGIEREPSEQKMRMLLFGHHHHHVIVAQIRSQQNLYYTRTENGALDCVNRLNSMTGCSFPVYIIINFNNTLNSNKNKLFQIFILHISKH